MKSAIISILIIIVICSCNHKNQSNTKTQLTENEINSFETCFEQLDTLISLTSTSCNNDIYALISKKHIIHIKYDEPSQYDTCLSMNVNSENKLIELLIFENESANLTDFCSDIEIINLSEPLRKTYAINGTVTFRFTNKTKYFENGAYQTTAIINNLTFQDPKTKENINLRNALIWKVINTGTPG